MFPHCRPVVLLLAVGFVLVGVSTTGAIGIPGQRLAAETTVATLPEPLHGFLAARLEGVLERTIEPDGAWRDDARTRLRDEWHYLMLDAASPGERWEERLAAARAFPAQATAAQRIFRDANIKHGGRLPWELDGLVDQLTDAFRAGDGGEIVRYAGYVIHFSADAADPFAAARDGTGASAGCPAWTAALGDRWFAHRDARQRIGWELIRRNVERYRSELNPREIRFDLGVEDVPFSVVECLLSSFEQWADLCAADVGVLTEMGLLTAGQLDADAFAARLDEYYLLLDARAGQACIQNLRRSVGLASTLIVTAWLRAGSPNPVVPAPAESAPAPAALTGNAGDGKVTHPGAATPTPAPTPAPAAVLFVASRKSKVYHRTDCAHAARITAANRVEYHSSQEAEAAGKRPCQTCRPDQTTAGPPEAS